MSVYSEMRAILSLDLKPNELKVWMTYRLEMDEQARSVRGKSQSELREVCGLNVRQFKAASSGLVELGLISVQKRFQSPQEVSVFDLAKINTCRKSTRVENQSTEVSKTNTSEVSKIDTYTLYTAPVIDSKSAPVRASTRDDDPMPSHVKPISDWSQAFARPDDNHGVELVADKLVLVNGTRAEWLSKFDGDATALDLALIEARGSIQPNSRAHPLKAQVERHLARIAGKRHDQNQRYANAVASKKPKIAKPTEGETPEQRELRIRQMLNIATGVRA